MQHQVNLNKALTGFGTAASNDNFLKSKDVSLCSLNQSLCILLLILFGVVTLYTIAMTESSSEQLQYLNNHLRF
jgi:hypothetical protein